MSLAAAWPVFAGNELALHSIVTSAGDVLNDGAVVSCTVIVWV